MFFNIILGVISYLLLLTGGVFLIALIVRLVQAKRDRVFVRLGGVAAIFLIGGFLVLRAANAAYPVHFAMPPMMHSHTPDGMPASMPYMSALKFVLGLDNFEKVDDVGADPNAVPAPIVREGGETVRLDLTAKEVIGEIAPGIWFNYWTYNGTTPGPMLRVKEGDTVELFLTNDASSMHAHNIDLHAVNGPGGGASLTDVQPGETKGFRWKALQPGLYEYHCAMANVSVHNSHGQYGLILVEPKDGLAPVDKEFYVMQGELYTKGMLGSKGFKVFDPEALLRGEPQYILMNGKVESAPRMHARVGDRIRMYVGNGGVNTISSFHIIGEIFDTVYPEGGIGGSTLSNIQTTIIPAGGASIVEFTVDVPGKYLLVDHALSRMNRGAWAVLEVTGEDQEEIFSPIEQ